MRYCEDIDMWAFDRGLASCVHRTAYCAEHCYNKKLYRLYPNMLHKDECNEIKWEFNYSDQANFVRDFNRKRKGCRDRFRFATRGETFDTVNSLLQTRRICNALPDVLFWIPTRAWRDGNLLTYMVKMQYDCPNVRIMCSLDPTTEDKREWLNAVGFSTMTFGVPYDRMVYEKCPKTHHHIKGACSQCNLCFSKEVINVHLKEH